MKKDVKKGKDHWCHLNCPFVIIIIITIIVFVISEEGIFIAYSVFLDDTVQIFY